MEKSIFLAFLIILLVGCNSVNTPPTQGPSAVNRPGLQTEQTELDLQAKSDMSLEIWRQMGGAPVFSSETMNSAVASRLFMQYCTTTGQKIPYSSQDEGWVTAAPVDEFISTYFGITPEQLRERDAENTSSKLYDPQMGYIAPVNLSGTPDDIELLSAEQSDTNTISMLLEYHYTLSDGGKYSEKMLLTADISAKGIHFLSCSIIE